MVENSIVVVNMVRYIICFSLILVRDLYDIVPDFSVSLAIEMAISHLNLDLLQGVALDVLATAGVIRSHHFWLDVEHIEEAIQNVLVLLEMVVFSVLQQYAYNVAPYTGVDARKSISDKKNE